MKGFKGIVLLGIVALVIGIIALFPARTAYTWFAPPGIQLNGIDGTVWSGSAAEGLAGGVYLRDISWALRPQTILTGQLGFATRFDPASGFVDADVSVSPTGSIELSDVSGVIALDTLQGAVGPLRGIRGNLHLDISSAVIENGLPTALEGVVHLMGLASSVVSPSPIGDYEARFTNVDDGIRGEVTDVSGVLSVDAELTISQNRGYSLVGQVAARPDAPTPLVQQLQLLGSADAQGYREFRIEGQL